MSTEQLRSVKIKVGAVKRTAKEYRYYFAEKEREQAKLEKMEKEEADSYDIKQQQNVVQESAMMIPETKKSLEAILADLKGYLEEVALDSECEDAKQAAEVVEDAEKALAAA